MHIAFFFLRAAAFSVLLCTAGVPLALAQGAPAASAPIGDRAARDAQNPLRVILEASKLKVRVKADTAAPELPADRRVARPKPPLPPAAPGSAVAKAAAPAARSAASAPPPPAEPRPAPEPAAQAAASQLAASATALAVRPAPAPRVPLKNVHMVEPILPPAALRRMRGGVEVVVGFTVNADGTVSDASIKSSPMKALEEPVLAAIRQWRYEPIGEARLHAVQLVLHAEP